MLLQFKQYKGCEHTKRHKTLLLNGGGLVECTWQYDATTDNPSDPMLGVECECEYCTQRAKKGLSRLPLVKWKG
jgi:hypothetical protein